MTHEWRKKKCSSQEEGSSEQGDAKYTHKTVSKNVPKTKECSNCNAMVQRGHADYYRTWSSRNLLCYLTIVFLTVVLMTTLGCHGVGFHVDQYGARIGKETIVREVDGDNIYLYMHFTGIGFFWYPLFGK